eukprot:g988.t1
MFIISLQIALFMLCLANGEADMFNEQRHHNAMMAEALATPEMLLNATSKVHDLATDITMDVIDDLQAGEDIIIPMIKRETAKWKQITNGDLSIASFHGDNGFQRCNEEYREKRKLWQNKYHQLIKVFDDYYEKEAKKVCDDVRTTTLMCEQVRILSSEQDADLLITDRNQQAFLGEQRIFLFYAAAERYAKDLFTMINETQNKIRNEMKRYSEAKQKLKDSRNPMKFVEHRKHLRRSD